MEKQSNTGGFRYSLCLKIRYNEHRIEFHKNGYFYWIMGQAIYETASSFKQLEAP